MISFEGEWNSQLLHENPKLCSEALKPDVDYGFVNKNKNCLIVDVIWQDERAFEPEPLKLSDEIEDKCAKKQQPRSLRNKHRMQNPNHKNNGDKSNDRANRQMCRQYKKNGLTMSEEILELCKKYNVRTKNKKP